MKTNKTFAALLLLALFQTGCLLAGAKHDDAGTQKRVADAELAAQIWDALAQDQALDTRRLQVRATQGRVRLAGRMRTLEQATQVEDITARIDGVRDVTSLMRAGT